MIAKRKHGSGPAQQGHSVQGQSFQSRELYVLKLKPLQLASELLRSKWIFWIQLL